MFSGALESPYFLPSHPTAALASHIAIILTFTLQPPSLYGPRGLLLAERPVEKRRRSELRAKRSNTCRGDGRKGVTAERRLLARSFPRRAESEGLLLRYMLMLIGLCHVYLSMS